MNFDVDCFVSIYAGTSSSWFNSKENPRMRIFLYNKSVLFTRISPHVRFTSRYLLINSVLRQAYSRFESARIWSWLHCPCSNQGRPRCSSWTDRISEFTVKINFFVWSNILCCDVILDFVNEMSLKQIWVLPADFLLKTIGKNPKNAIHVSTLCSH